MLAVDPSRVRNFAIRTGELQTETLLRTPEVIANLRVGGSLRKTFLHEVRQWILTGAYSQPGTNHVHQIYQDVVLAAYIRGAITLKATESKLADFKDLAENWSADNPDGFFTTQLLDTLFNGMRDRRKEEDANT